MPPPVRADYDTRERRVLERASEETRRMNEAMDRMDANLDNMSDSLKERFKQIVISQLSLMKYRQDDVFEDNLNIYTSQPAKKEHQTKIMAETNNCTSRMTKEIKCFNSNRQCHQQDFRGDEKYSYKTTSVGRSNGANSTVHNKYPYKVDESNNKYTGSPYFDTEAVNNRDINNRQERLDIKISKTDGNLNTMHTQAFMDVREDNANPTTVKENSTFVKRNAETSPVSKNVSRKDQMPNDVKTLRIEMNIHEQTMGRPDTKAKVIDKRFTSEFEENTIKHISRKSLVVNGDQNDTQVTNNNSDKTCPFNSSITRMNREVKLKHENATANEHKNNRTNDALDSAAENLHTNDKYDTRKLNRNDATVNDRDKVISVNAGCKYDSNNRASPVSKSIANRSRDINDIREVKESHALKKDTRSNSGAQYVIQDTDNLGSIPLENNDSTDSHEHKQVRCSTPVSRQYDWRIHSLSFSPISATAKTHSPSPAKQNQPSSLQGSPVTRKLQTLVSSLEEYNDHALIHTTDAREVQSRNQENDASQKYLHSLSSSNSPQAQAVEVSKNYHNGSGRQTRVRDSDNDVRKTPTLPHMGAYQPNIGGRNIPSISASDSSDLAHEISFVGSRIQSPTPSPGLHFQSTIKYTPIKNATDSSIVPKSMNHKLYCTDCSESEAGSEQFLNKVMKQEKKEINSTDTEKEGTKEIVRDNQGGLGIFRTGRASTKATGGHGTMRELIPNRTPTNRNTGSFNGTNTSPDEVPFRRTAAENEAENSHTKSFSRYTTEDECEYTTSRNRDRGTSGVHDILPNKAIQRLGQADTNTSALIGAYANIKMKLFNSALNSLMSSMKSTVEENVGRDLDHEIWTALNRSVTEMTEEFQSYVADIGSQNIDTWSVDLDHLDALVQQLLSDGPCRDRLRLRDDVDDAMCRLRSHLEDACRARRSLSPEVEKILATLKNLTESFAVCGNRFFGNGSTKERNITQYIVTLPENVESTSMSNGFLATANRIRQRLMKSYARPKTIDTVVKAQDNETNTSHAAADSTARSELLKEIYSNNSGQRMKSTIPFGDTLTRNDTVPVNSTAPETQSVNPGNSDQRPMQTTPSVQQPMRSINRSPQQGYLPSLSQRRMDDFRNIGLLVLLIFGTAKFLAHFGPAFLQVVYDIFVGMMMYLSCSIRLVHYDPNIT